MADDDSTTLSEGAITEFEPNRRWEVEFQNGDYAEEVSLTAKGDVTLTVVDTVTAEEEGNEYNPYPTVSQYPRSGINFDSPVCSPLLTAILSKFNQIICAHQTVTASLRL